MRIEGLIGQTIIWAYIRAIYDFMCLAVVI